MLLVSLVSNKYFHSYNTGQQKFVKNSVKDQIFLNNLNVQTYEQV